jgi:hypothetical protein
VTVLATVLASSTNSTSTINDVEPGLLGFLVVAALGLALVFLLRSMNKQLKKIGPKPGSPEDFAAGAEAEGASEAANQRPLRGLAAHRAALAAAAAEEDAEQKDARRD